MCGTCTCGTTSGVSVLGSIGEVMGDKNMWGGGAAGLAAAVTVSWVLGNLLWLGLGVGLVVAAGVTWGVRRIIREHRSAPQSSMWTPDKARTVPRGAIGAARPAVAGPARTALPGPQRALPAASPVLPGKLAADLTELGVAIYAAKDGVS